MARLSDRTRETLQVVGSIAGIVAFIGTIVLWLTTRSALDSVASQTVTHLKATGAKPDTSIVVEFNPLSGLGWLISWPTLAVALAIALGVVLYKNRTPRS